jgi:glutathione S-transferase
LGKGDGELEPGPYLLGATFSLADVKLVPYMERAAASLPFYRGLSVRTGGQWPALERWFAAMELTLALILTLTLTLTP